MPNSPAILEKLTQKEPDSDPKANQQKEWTTS